MSRVPFVITALLTAAGLVGCADGSKQGDDLPPMIVDAYAEDGDPIELEEDRTVVWIAVYDEDMDGLEYVWVTSDWGTVPPELVQRNPEGSQVTLERNPDLHGQELTVQVTDAGGSSIRLDWPLIVKAD